MPEARDEVVTEGGMAAAATTIESDLVAVADAASVTLAVKLAVPDAVGVPEMTPELLRLRPAGSEPLVRAHA